MTGSDAADDEAEEARAGRGERGGRAHFVEEREHLVGRQATLGQRRAEAREAGHGFAAGRDAAVLDSDK